MIYDASDFPMEGQSMNTEGLLPSVDFMLANMSKVQRRVGAKRPDYIPPNISNEPPQPTVENVGMPEPIVQQKTQQTIIQKQPSVQNVSPLVHMQRNVVKAPEETTFFKDITGNRYKTVGEKLYVLGWQDADIEIRLVSEKTGKKVPTDGKKFQIYGWHLVNKMSDKTEVAEVSKLNTVEEKLKTVKVNPTDIEKESTQEKTVNTELNAEKVEEAETKQTKTRRTKRLI